MNSPLTDLSHSIDKLEIVLGSLSTEENCYTTFAAEIARLKRVRDDFPPYINERERDAVNDYKDQFDPPRDRD